MNLLRPSIARCESYIVALEKENDRLVRERDEYKARAESQQWPLTERLRARVTEQAAMISELSTELVEVLRERDELRYRVEELAQFNADKIIAAADARFNK